VASVPDLVTIVPSRGRPSNVDRLWWAFKATADKADLVVAVDEDDPHLEGYLDMLERAEGGYELVVGPRLRMVGTLNKVATEHTEGYRYVGFMGDDHLPRSKGWDTAYIAALDGASPGGVVYGNDLIQGEIMPTQVALDRRIVETLGYMVPPELVHLAADLFWCEIGKALGTLRYLPDVVIEHLHPLVGRAEWDPGYAEANSLERSSEDHTAYQDYLSTRFVGDVAKLKEHLGGAA
jgi:hypothetical protein